MRNGACPSATTCCRTASRSSTPARNPAPAPRVTWWCARASRRSILRKRKRTTCSTRRGTGAELAALLPGDRQGQRPHHRDPQVHHQHGQGNKIETAMKWTDTLEIAIALSEKYPDVDPLTVRFTDLFEWVQALDEFDDDPKHCGEKILEAIQMAWIDEST